MCSSKSSDKVSVLLSVIDMDNNLSFESFGSDLRLRSGTSPINTLQATLFNSPRQIKAISDKESGVTYHE